MAGTPHGLLIRESAGFGSRPTWLGKLWSIGHRLVRWLDRATSDVRAGPDVPVFATRQATPARAARRTVIVSGEHYPGEPFALTRQFEHELELSIELEPEAPRLRRRARRHGRKGAKRWTP